jgi:hypothetical protein
MGKLRQFEDDIKDVGRKIDDELLQPVKNTVEAIIDDPKKLLAVGIAVAFPGAGAFLGAQLGLTGVAAQVVGQTMLNTALNGGDVKSAVIAAAIPVVGKTAAAGISSTLAESGIEGVLNKTITNSLVQGGTAAALGKDPAAAFLFGGVSSAVPAVTSQIPGFDELPDFAKQSIISGVTAEITGGDGGQAAVNSALSYAKKEAGAYFRDLGLPQNSDMIEGYFAPGGEGYIAPPTYAPETRGYFDEENVRFVPDENGALTFGQLTNETSGTNIESMDDYTYNPDTGNWTLPDGTEIDTSYMQNSQTPLTGQQVMDTAGASGGSQTPSQPGTPPKQPSAPGQDIDMNQLMSLLGGGQQAAPMVVSSGQDNSADVQLMENIFGTNLSAPPAGDLNAQTRELARLLRS